MIAMPKIWHGFFHNTDLCGQNFQKSPEQLIIAGKMVFLKFLELYLTFFHETLHTDAKYTFLKGDEA